MAQFGSALEWGSRGRKFNSCHPDQQAKLSLLRAKKRRLHRRFFLLFFASLCPSQKTRQSEMRDARKMLAIPSLCSLQFLSPRPREGAKANLLHFFKPIKSAKVSFAESRGKGCKAKHNLLCFSKSLFPRRLAPSLFAKSGLFASRSLRSPKIRLFYN